MGERGSDKRPNGFGYAVSTLRLIRNTATYQFKKKEKKRDSCQIFKLKIPSNVAICESNMTGRLWRYQQHPTVISTLFRPGFLWSSGTGRGGADSAPTS